MVEQDSATGVQIGLVAAVWRHRWLVLAITVMGALLAGAFAVATAKDTKAEASVALTDPRGNSVFRQGSAANIDLNRYTAERGAFAESEQVLARAAKALGDGATAESVDGQVKVTPSNDKSILTITANGASTKESIKIADAVAKAYQELSADETKAKAAVALGALETQRQQAQTVLRTPTSTAAEISAATQTLSAVNSQAAQIQSAAELFGNGVSFYDPARAVKSGGLMAILRTAVAGGLIGMVIGASIAWVLADREEKRGQNEGEDEDETDQSGTRSTTPPARWQIRSRAGDRELVETSRTTPSPGSLL